MIFDEQKPTSWDINFRIFRVPVRVSIWFWVLTFLLGYDLVKTLGPEYLLIWVACVFVSILLHELGHVWMGQAFGNDGRIVLQSFCGLAIGSNGQPYRWQRILVSLAGPGIQLLFVGLMLIVLHLIDQRPQLLIDAISANARQEYKDGKIDFFHSIINPIFGVTIQPTWSEHLQMTILFLFEINLFWALLNLLPVWPLDGGKVSRELFTSFNPQQGVRNSLALSLVTSLVLVVNSASLMMDGPGIPYMPSGGWFMVCLFVYFAYENFVYIQMERARSLGGWSDSGDDRMPWETDPDAWKR